MGHNFPKQLALRLRDAAKLKIFVETGTYKGDTCRWAADHFDCVFTIEAYRPRYEKTLPSLQSFPNIEAIYGDSRVKLSEILDTPIIVFPALIWLDAHWCGEGAHDSNGDECPLMEELTAINDSIMADQHFILIDDARLFQSPPPYPHDPKQWPHIDSFIKNIGTDDRVVQIKHDMIVSVPKRYAGLLDQEWF